MRLRLVIVSLFAMAVASAADVPKDTVRLAWNALNTSLNGGDTEHRREALAAVGTIDGQNALAVKAATDALRDKNAEVRQAAALVLGEMKADSAIPALKQALDDSPEVAFAAAKSLSQLGDDTGRDVLVEVLAGERKDIKPGMLKNAAHEGKSKLHHPGGLVLMGAQDATGAMFGPVSFAFPAVKDAVGLHSKGAPARAAAAAYIARDPDPYAITLLEWALNDEHEFVRLEAARGLGQRGNAESVAKLRPLLDDPHTIVRDFAAAAIVRIGDRAGAAGEPSSGPVDPTTTKKAEHAGR